MDRCLLDVINDHGALEEFLEPDGAEASRQHTSASPAAPAKDVIAEAWNHAALASLSQHDSSQLRQQQQLFTQNVPAQAAPSRQIVFQTANVTSQPTVASTQQIVYQAAASPLQKHVSQSPLHNLPQQSHLITHSPLSAQSRPSQSPLSQQISASPLSQPSPSPTPAQTPSPLPQALPRSMSPMIRPGQVLNQPHGVVTSVQQPQQLGVPMVTMVSGLTVLPQPPVHTTMAMQQQQSSQVTGTPAVMQSAAAGLVNLNQLRAARAIQIRPQPPAVNTAAGTLANIQPASMPGGQMNIQGTLIHTSTGNKLLIQGQQFPAGQPINVANLQGLQTIQGLQLRPQQLTGSVAQTLPTPTQGQPGVATAQLIRTPQGQQIIIQHAPQGGASAPNQNIILRTIPPNVIQIPGTSGPGAAGVMGQPGLGIIQQVAQNNQQTVTNIVQPSTTLSSNLTTQPGQPPPPTQIQGQLDQGKGMLTINVGGQNINIGQLNLQQLKGVPAGMNILPSQANPNQIKQAAPATAAAAAGLQISNLQAQIAQLQALHQQQQLVGTAAAAVQNGQMQTVGQPPLLQTSGMAQTPLPNVQQTGAGQAVGIQNVGSGQTMAVLPQTMSLSSQQQQPPLSGNMVVAPSTGMPLVQVTNQGIVLGHPAGLYTGQIGNTATASGQAGQVNAPGVIAGGHRPLVTQNSPAPIAFQSNQKPLLSKSAKPTPAEPLSVPDPLQAALMESQIGPLDSEIITAPPNQIAPLPPHLLQSTYQNTTNTAQKLNTSAAVASSTSLPTVSQSTSLSSTAVVFPQTVVCSASGQANIPHLSASQTALPGHTQTASSGLHVPQTLPPPAPSGTPAKLPLPPRRPIQIRPSAPTITTANITATTSVVSAANSQPVNTKTDVRPAKPIAAVQPTSAAVSASQNVRPVQNAMNAAQNVIQTAQLQAQQSSTQSGQRVQTITLNPHTQQMLVKLQNRIRTLQKTETKTQQEDQELQKLLDVYQKIIQQAKLQAQQLVQQQSQQPVVPGGQPVLPQTAAAAAPPRIPGAQPALLGARPILPQPVTVQSVTTSQPQLRLLQPNVQITSSANLQSHPQVVTISSGITMTVPSVVQDKPIVSAPAALLVKSSVDSLSTGTVVTTATPAKLPIPANAKIAQIRIGNQIIHVQADLKEKVQAQLAKLTPEQQQLFFKHQQTLIAQRQRQLQQQQAGGATSTSLATTGATTGLKLPVTIQAAGKVLPTLKPIPVAGQTVVTQAGSSDRGIKRPAPPPTLSKAALILQSLTRDQNAALKPTDKSEFKNKKDAVRRLLRYHVFHSPDPHPAQLCKEDEAFEEQSQGLLNKFTGMLDKYRSLLYQESMRTGQTSEMVMIERIFLNDEKENFESEKRLAVEDPDTFVPMPILANTSTDEDFSDHESSCSTDASPIKQTSGNSSSSKSLTAVRTSTSKDGLKIVIKNLRNTSDIKSENKSKHQKQLDCPRSPQGGTAVSKNVRSNAAQDTPDKTDTWGSSHSSDIQTMVQNIKTEPTYAGYPADIDSSSSLQNIKSETKSTDPVTDISCQNGFLMDFLKKETEDDAYLNELERDKMKDEAYIQDVVSSQLPFAIYSERGVMEQTGDKEAAKQSSGQVKSPQITAPSNLQSTEPPAGQDLTYSTQQQRNSTVHPHHNPAASVMQIKTEIDISMETGAGDGLHQVATGADYDLTHHHHPISDKSSGDSTSRGGKATELNAAVDSIVSLFDEDPVTSHQMDSATYSTGQDHGSDNEDDDFDMAEFDRLQSCHAMDYNEHARPEVNSFGQTAEFNTTARAQSGDSLSDFINQNLTESESSSYHHHTSQTDPLSRPPADDMAVSSHADFHLSAEDRSDTNQTAVSRSQTRRNSYIDSNNYNTDKSVNARTPDYNPPSNISMDSSFDADMRHHKPDFDHSDMKGPETGTSSMNFHYQQHTTSPTAVTADVLDGFSQKSDFSMFEEEEEEGFGGEVNEQVESAINSILSLQHLDMPGSSQQPHVSPQQQHQQLSAATIAAADTPSHMMDYSSQEEADDSDQEGLIDQQAEQMEDDLDAAVQSILL